MTGNQSSGRVLQIFWMERVVSSLSCLSAFYRDALGFQACDAGGHAAPIWDDLLNARIARSAFLRLGQQRLRLLEFEEPAQPYPADSNSADLWFQHIAVVVADMDQAYTRLKNHHARPISGNGPQQLPPSTGDVKAFKFRDPDGHPLELISFPSGSGDPQWQQSLPSGCTALGIDHSALSVSDAEASTAFYCNGLGLSLTSRQVNSGAAQERLDALPGAMVDVIALTCANARTPHIELLAYRQPQGRRPLRPIQPTEIASDKLILQVDDLAATLARLDQTCIVHQAKSTAYAAALVRDPDGHLLTLTDMPTPQQGAFHVA